jgi:hypothetical protein
MKSHHELLILQNAMDCKVDIYITNFNIKPRPKRVAININQIVSIHHDYTKYDKINTKYFVINLINGEKIYVNEMNHYPTGLFETLYSKNKDYEVVDTFIYDVKNN